MCGSILQNLYRQDGIMSSKLASVWWKDLHYSVPYAQKWFTRALRPKLGSGNCLQFWHDRWCYQQSLKELFPLLYSISDRQFGVVAEFGFWAGNRWHWQFNWSREANQEEQTEALLVENTLSLLQPTEFGDDEWTWMLD